MCAAVARAFGGVWVYSSSGYNAVRCLTKEQFGRWASVGLFRRSVSSVGPSDTKTVLQTGHLPPSSCLSAPFHRLVQPAVYTCFGDVAREDGTTQVAIKTGVDYHFAGLSAHTLLGRNVRTLPLDGSDELRKGAFEDLAPDQK